MKKRTGQPQHVRGAAMTDEEYAPVLEAARAWGVSASEAMRRLLVLGAGVCDLRNGATSKEANDNG